MNLGKLEGGQGATAESESWVAFLGVPREAFKATLPPSPPLPQESENLGG